MSNNITTAVPSADTLVATAFVQVDYRDAYVVHGADRLATVDDVATAYFLGQPRWLSALSMNLFSRRSVTEAVEHGRYEPGSSVGSWTIRQRSENEIVFGDDMGFMEYCFSFCRRPDGTVEASTAVAHRWRRASRLYFALVKPIHRRFVPISLRALSDDASAGGATR